MSEPSRYEEWEAKQIGRSYEMVREVQKYWGEMVAGKKEGFEVGLFVATGFGTHRVTALFGRGSDIIMLCILGSGEYGETVFAPVEQCVFSFRHFRPTPEHPKIIVGFGPESK